jgi:mono/diheme cytochrome c family protein
MMTTRGWFLVVALGLSACGDNGEKVTPDASVDATSFDYVARGQYIMNVTAACTFCHTPLLPNGTRDNDNLLAGVDCFVDLDNPPTFVDNMNGTGCLSTRNLTKHETGLKNATDAQIKNAFRNGVRTDNKNIFPIMPYYLFHNMTDQDADSIVAYLRTVPGVNHTVKPNEQPFAAYNEGLPSGFDYVPFLTDTEIPLPQGGANNASAMRGRYLTSTIGLCIDCHTPEVAPFTFRLDATKAFAGGRVFPKGQLGLVDPAATYPDNIATRNLTSDATGLGGWTPMQISQAIAEGRDKDNKQVCAATHGGAISPYAALEEQDLADIVEYIAHLAPIVNDTATDTNAANCGLPPIGAGPETGVECGNGLDEDLDTLPDDGCPVACGDCQGPTVP